MEGEAFRQHWVTREPWYKINLAHVAMLNTMGFELVMCDTISLHKPQCDSITKHINCHSHRSHSKLLWGSEKTNCICLETSCFVLTWQHAIFYYECLSISETFMGVCSLTDATQMSSLLSVRPFGRKSQIGKHHTWSPNVTLTSTSKEAFLVFKHDCGDLLTQPLES